MNTHRRPSLTALTFAPFLAPRRLALLAAFVFILTMVFFPTAHYSGYLPSTRIAAYWWEHGGREAVRESLASSNVGTLQCPELKAPTGCDMAKNITSTSERIKDLIKTWAPPAIQDHWPPYEWYGPGSSFSPNRWEGFPWQNNFYINNGIKELAEEQLGAATPVAYMPYPRYNSRKWKDQWIGKYMPCEGPRSRLLNESTEDLVYAYPDVPRGFPEAVVGDAHMTGTDKGFCIDRYHRYGPYGYGQKENRGIDQWQRPEHEPKWSSLQWGLLQDKCLTANKDRYKWGSRQATSITPGKDMPKQSFKFEGDKPDDHSPRYHSRTAILVRTWTGYNYTDNDSHALRALITETSLLSGGEYQVFLLVDIKDEGHEGNISIPEVRQGMLDYYVPDEFHDITILFNERMMTDWYPRIGDWQIYWHQFMPLQWYSKTHPEFDFVWNWETDARYTGNHYHFLEKVSEFARDAPRKYLWERNSRFYLPAAHGTYEQWLDDTHDTIESAARKGTLKPVWGPYPYDETVQKPISPNPPRTMTNDTFQWGVGEEADLVTLQPIWDPINTEWTFRDKIWNFVPGITPHFSIDHPLDEQYGHPDFVHIPRRTYINTLSRFSKRQLHAMHLENTAGRTMAAEMWPATVALHHGLKAVYAPHPIWADRKWPAWYLDAVSNADGGETAHWGAGNDSVYNNDREHNFAGWSWYYSSDFPRILYRRWLGWEASVGSKEQFPNNLLRTAGGRDFEERGVMVSLEEDTRAVPPSSRWFGEEKVHVGGRGRMCLPPMLLHPVKNVFEEHFEQS